MKVVKRSPIAAAMIVTPDLCSGEEISSLRAARQSLEQLWPSWSQERCSATSRDPGPRVFRSRHQEGQSGPSASLRLMITPLQTIQDQWEQLYSEGECRGVRDSAEERWNNNFYEFGWRPWVLWKVKEEQFPELGSKDEDLAVHLQ